MYFGGIYKKISKSISEAIHGEVRHLIEVFMEGTYGDTLKNKEELRKKEFLHESLKELFDKFLRSF